MKIRSVIIAVLAAAMLAGCTSSSPVGLVDIARLTANWPKYINYQNQLSADEQAIDASKVPIAQKQREAAKLSAHYAQLQNELVKQVRDAATQVAQQRSLKLVLTREFVGYGGTDITPAVEKILGITEKATPTP